MSSPYFCATHTGLFQRGKQHGEGKLVLPNGIYYVGGWADDFMHGFGTLRNVNETLIHQGLFERGVFVRDMEPPVMRDGFVNKSADKEYAMDKLRKKLAVEAVTVDKKE